MAVWLYLASKPLNPIIRTKHISSQHKWPQEIIIKKVKINSNYAIYMIL